MKGPHDLEFDRSVAGALWSIYPERELWTDIERRITQKCIVALRAPSSTVAVVASVAILLCGCSKVNVTPLGSTSEGRQQFQITCNERASDSGSCHGKALGACGGDYETLDVDNTFTTPSKRVLLIACNR